MAEFQNIWAARGTAWVGHKTASVVMSQGFGYPAFPIDTYIDLHKGGDWPMEKCNSNWKRLKEIISKKLGNYIFK